MSQQQPPQQPCGRPGTSSIIEQFRKLHPPVFEGGPDPLATEEWLRHLERIFRFMECTDAQKILCAVFMMEKGASHWWEMTTRSRTEEQQCNLTWAQFKEIVLQKYFPVTLRDKKEAEFAPHLVDTEERHARRFERGLRIDIRKAVAVFQLSTYQGVLEKAQVYTFGDDQTRESSKQQTSSLDKHKNLKRENAWQENVSVTNVASKDTSQKTALRDNLRTKDQKVGKARVFALTQEEAELDYNVVAGIISISDTPALILIDSRATHSFISSIFILKSNIECVPLDSILEVSLPSGKGLNTNYIARNLNLETDEKIIRTDLVVLDMKDFDVILGMDWLSKIHATIRCFEKDVIFQRPGEEEFHFFGTRVKPLPRLISAVQAIRLLKKKSAQGFLVSLTSTDKKELTIDEVPVVKNFSDVFPENILGMPPNREVEFTIDLVPGATPISKAPYRMAPVKLQELKV
ncbi:uncharacterized protein LOC111379977 [Olea europaea var. sylvestris]|uniref:uncharacterized protein LOC111379977 n=1 Tax=Olea europaea var. sylvestris TaxID=158386 RepID=UPI000C1D46E1|nr:uncharacterized protein LOC111379977 [Olea europaea var. sylvestris]